MMDELKAARQRLEQAQAVQQRRLNQEATEKAAIKEAERQLQAVEKQKAASDFSAATHENAALHAQNQQAAAAYRAALDNLLSAFKPLLVGLPGAAVQTTFEAAQQQARGAAGTIQRQALGEYSRAHPEQSGYEATVQVMFSLYEAVRVLHAPWPIESVLSAWTRDATGEQERRARLGIVYALYGGELFFPPDVTDAAVQAQLDRELHDRLSGGRG